MDSPAVTRSSSVQFLTFDVGGRKLALPAAAILEVTRAVAVTPLPKAPPIVEGAINVRGTLVPVLDIRQRFGLPPRALTLDQHFILARAGPRSVALRVDRASDLVSVEEAAIESAEGVVPGVEHVAGIARLPDGLLVIQDLDRFLSLEEAEQVDAATTGTAPPGRAATRRTGR